MTTKHTPGPWLVHSSSTLHMNDVQIASVYDHWRIVSHTERGPLDGARNANLIAAAPDLLAACEAFREGTECLCCGGFPWCLHDRDKPHHLADALLAAVKKARG